MKEQTTKIKKILYGIIGILVVLLIGIAVYKLGLEKLFIFKKYEQDFLNAAKKYYEINKIYSNKESDVKEVTLSTLYSQKYIESINIPKSDKSCSTTSWVKMVKRNGDYQYIVYLECGKYKSNVDHTGPLIELNGEEEITIALNSEYKELGVKSVQDDYDGKMKSDSVTIDNSKVDTTKMGSYKVTYTVYDTLKNKTVKERIVNVVRFLKDEIVSKTNGNNNFKGVNVNNYIWYDGFLWRIIGINEDGTISIITDEPVTTLPWGEEKTPYEKSYIKAWLDEEFTPLLKDEANVIEKKTKWCMKKPDTGDEDTNNCYKTIESLVHMLTINEYQNSLDENASSYLQDSASFAFVNQSMWDYASFNKNMIEGNYGVFEKKYWWNKTTVASGIRPVIRLKKDSAIISGVGSKTDPYLFSILDNTENKNLNTRKVGEYISFSNLLWRIVSINEDGTVKIILNQLILDDGWHNSLEIIFDKEKNKVFDPNNSNNVGYYLNNEFIKRLNSDRIVTTNFKVGAFDEDSDYRKLSFENVKAKVGLAVIGEMFTSQPNYTYSPLWLLNYVTNYDKINVIAEGYFYWSMPNKNEFYGGNTTIRPVITLDNKMKIISGDGLPSKPFIIR